jgi:hypothetical protein
MRLKRAKRYARERAVVENTVAACTQWREECDAVRNAYLRWLGASVARKTNAFDDYRGALDREERAARRDARLMGRARHLAETGLGHQLVQILNGRLAGWARILRSWPSSARTPPITAS